MCNQFEPCSKRPIGLNKVCTISSSIQIREYRNNRVAPKPEEGTTIILRYGSLKIKRRFQANCPVPGEYFRNTSILNTEHECGLLSIF